MAKMQIRIDRPNMSPLAKSAKANSRSIPKEANRILAEYFSCHSPSSPAISKSKTN